MKVVAIALVAAVSVLAARPVEAQMIKCTDANGKQSFSDRPCAANERSQTLAVAAKPVPAGTSGVANGAHGLSFALATELALPTPVAHLSCHGEPSQLDRPHAGSCNPYQGDMACRAALPVACIKTTGARAPERLEQTFYKGWVGGQLGATSPVAGTALGSEKTASSLCESQLGAGWRMAEVHDGRGGWGLQGERAAGIKPGMRYWVHINDQRGNCWDSKP